MAVKEFFLLTFLTVQVSCGRNTLTFVIDNTMSMSNEIEKVKNAAKSIVDIVLKEKSSQIEDIVLVTFNDPDTVFRKRTRNEKELKQALDSISVYGGGDCPEMALTGIKRALEESQPGSYLYVFTDATAKDFNMLEQIKTLSQEKQSQIVIILTGDCNVPNAIKQVYNEIAAASNGQVFRINKDEVGQVLEYVKETIKGDRTVITSTIVPAHTWRDIKFKIDDQTEYAIVSASGTDVFLQVLDQHDTLMSTGKHITWTKNVKVLKLTNLSVGTYKVRVLGNSEVNIMIFGRTDFTFEHGFSTNMETSLRTTETQPTIDVKTHLMVSVKDPEHSANVQSVELLDMKEEVIRILPLKHVQGDVYATEKFLSPEFMFKIAVVATARNSGKIVRRIAKTPVTPIKPVLVAPEISKTDEYIKVKEGDSVNVYCRIRKGKPKPQITWFSRSQHATSFQLLSGKTDDVLHVTNAVTNDYYKCVAQNKVGKDEHTVQLDVQARPEFVKTPAVITKNEGEKVEIECKLRKGNPTKITWQFKPSDTDTYNLMRHGGEVLSITAVQLGQTGEYLCSAENAEGRGEKITKLIVQVKPVIEKPIPITTVMENTTATVECRVTRGFPKPIVNWFYKGPHSSEYAPISENKESVRIKNIQLNNAGQYKCVAVNTVGQSEQIIQLVVNAPPRIVFIPPNTPNYVGVEGDVVMNLPCTAVGHPTPTVTWIVDKQVISRDKSKDIHVDGNALVLKNPKEKHSTNHSYICHASNEFGQADQTYHVEISVFAEIDKGNTSYGLHKQPLVINCSLPYTDPSSVRWYKNSIYHNKTGPSLVFENPTLEDSNNYTCRVSDANGAASQTIEVIIGYPPMKDRTFYNVEWEGEEKFIDCRPNFSAEDKYEWTYNGEKVKDIHSSSLLLTVWGQYTCRVTNPFGSLLVNYNVTTIDKACVIPKSLYETKQMPLALDSSLSWPTIPTVGRYLIVPHSEKLQLICQDDKPSKSQSSRNGFTKFPNSQSVYATCDREESFLVDGVSRKFSELDCKDVVTASVIQTRQPCLGDNTQLMKVGFHVNGFTDVYQSCVDMTKNVPMYTKMNTIPRDDQSQGVQALKESCVDESKCCYEAIKLVSAADVSFGPAEKTTFIDTLNSVNYCKPKNEMSWHDLEMITRTETRYTVWSGALNYTKVEAILVPKYLWKVVKDVDTSEMIAIVHENVQTPGSKLCSGACAGESSVWFEPAGARTYCCHLDEFKKALGLTIDFEES